VKPLLAPYLEGVENRAHLVARDLYSLLQKPLIDYGAVKRASRALPLLADEQAYLLSQFSSVVSSSHRKKKTVSPSGPTSSREADQRRTAEHQRGLLSLLAAE
jgi:hypothetical protein